MEKKLIFQIPKMGERIVGYPWAGWWKLFRLSRKLETGGGRYLEEKPSEGVCVCVRETETEGRDRGS